jgi:hypothetical protein
MKKGGVEVGARCEGSVSLRAPGEKPAGHKGGRCLNAATHYLVNGATIQGQACEGCARRMLVDFAFLKMRPIT